METSKLTRIEEQVLILISDRWTYHQIHLFLGLHTEPNTMESILLRLREKTGIPNLADREACTVYLKTRSTPPFGKPLPLWENQIRALNMVARGCSYTHIAAHLQMYSPGAAQLFVFKACYRAAIPLTSIPDYLKSIGQEVQYSMSDPVFS